MKPLLTHARLKELISYDPDTGVFLRLTSKMRPDRIGSVAGAVNKCGYRMISLDNVRYYAHRLAWFYMIGEWPALLDHIDRDTLNNRFVSLRIATQTQNRINSRRRNGTSGLRGVWFKKSLGKWSATITVSYKRHFLGYHSTKEAAHTAYCTAAAKFHGEFARTE